MSRMTFSERSVATPDVFFGHATQITPVSASFGDHALEVALERA